MIYGNPMDKIVVVEADDPWTFSSEMNSIMLQEQLFYVDSTHIDAHKFKAILIKRQVDNEKEAIHAP